MFLREVINSLMRADPGGVFSVATGGGGLAAAWVARTCTRGVGGAPVKDGSALLCRADVDKRASLAPQHISSVPPSELWTPCQVHWICVMHGGDTFMFLPSRTTSLTFFSAVSDKRRSLPISEPILIFHPVLSRLIFFSFLPTLSPLVAALHPL